MTRKDVDHQTRKIFRPDQADLFEKSYEEELEEQRKQKVECLGVTFENDDARREHFLGILREKLKDPEFREIEGFPIGKDEDILALSDPPYYTACPNPWVGDFIKLYGKPYDPAEPYNREPFAADVSVGKTDAIYRAHSYHTKVPHLAIVPSILHYTEPGDVVLDGFCGSGMTGVAAQWCGMAPEAYRKEVEAAWKAGGREKPRWGARRVVLGDLSPAATFIAANYNLPFNVGAFARASSQILDEVEDELGWMYETLHTDGKTKGRLEYTVWSEVFSCPDCAGEVIFLTQALDPETKRVKDAFPCPHCGAELTKKRLVRLYETHHDKALNSVVRTLKRKPVLIVYKIRKDRYEKNPDQNDLETLARVESLEWSGMIPIGALPYMHMTHERARMDRAGITHIHHFFLPRAAHVLGALWRKAKACSDWRIRHMLLYLLDQSIWGFTVQNRYRLRAYSHVNQCMTGIYYVPSQTTEVSPWYNLKGKIKRLQKAFESQYAQHSRMAIGTGSTACLIVPTQSVDYIFTDPPFGENIYYADLNFLVEAWHQVFTNATTEAIVDKAKKKGLPEYQRLMQLCFEEYYRVLKPGRWMTVVFHNSHNTVWIAIQEALMAAGFVVASVTTMDKKQGSYRQVTSSAMKEDLVVSAYKPNEGIEQSFNLRGGTEEAAWDFVISHLRQIPIIPNDPKGPVAVAERLEHRIYDLMVAFHVQRGVLVPLSASEFSAGLFAKQEMFVQRDEMWFLSEQIPGYDKWREKVRDVGQMELIPRDEATAIQWLRQELKAKPRTTQDLTAVFLRVTDWFRYEKPLDLSELLEQNFLKYKGEGDVPSQVHSYLSSNFKQLRKLEKDDPMLRAKGEDRWYVPEPNRAGDLEKMREKTLLKEFELYKQRTKKFSKQEKFRVEAVRAGFKKAWQEKDYNTIIEVAKKIRENMLQEDPKLLMFYDQALTRSEQS